MSQLFIASWGQDVTGKGLDVVSPAKTVAFLIAQKQLVPDTTVYVMTDYQLDLDAAFQQPGYIDAGRLDGTIGYKSTLFAGLDVGGTATAPIRFRPWGATSRTIDGGVNTAVAFNLAGAAAHIDIQGFVFKNCSISINPYTSGKTCHHILIRHCKFTSICATAELAFDMAPGSSYKSHRAIFTNNRTHHVAIDNCRFIDIGPTKPLAASQWHYASAIYRDKKGRIYHSLANKAGGIDLVQWKSWGGFDYPNEGVLVASAMVDAVPTFIAKAEVLAELGLTQEQVIALLSTSPAHWFQHSHAIYAQGWEITVSNCYFSHTSMGWQLKLDGNIGVGVKAVDQAKLASEGGFAYFDPVPDAKSTLQQYGLQEQPGPTWYDSNDFPALTDGIVRTHRVLGNCFDGRNQWTSLAALPPVGDVLPLDAKPEAWTLKGLVHDVLAGAQPKPMYSYALDNRKSNVLIHANDETRLWTNVETGQLYGPQTKTATALQVLAWSPKNVLLVNNDFNPPAPGAAEPTEYAAPGAAIMLNTWGWWSGGVLDPAGCKLKPLGADGVLTSPKFLLAVKGTVFVANRVYPWPGGAGLGSFFYFPNTRWLACDPKTEELGWYVQGKFFACLDNAVVKTMNQPTVWQESIPGPLRLAAPAGVFPGMPSFVTAQNDKRFYLAAKFVSMGLVQVWSLGFLPSPLDTGCSSNGCLGQKPLSYPLDYALKKAKTVPYAALFQGVPEGDYAGTGFLLPDINSQLAVAAANDWVTP